MLTKRRRTCRIRAILDYNMVGRQIQSIKKIVFKGKEQANVPTFPVSVMTKKRVVHGTEQQCRPDRAEQPGLLQKDLAYYLCCLKEVEQASWSSSQ